jgi:hypothetical protein
MRAGSSWIAPSSRQVQTSGRSWPAVAPDISPPAGLRTTYARIAGVLWTCSIFPLFAPTRVRGAVGDRAVARCLGSRVRRFWPPWPGIGAGASNLLGGSEAAGCGRLRPA